MGGGESVVDSAEPAGVVGRLVDADEGGPGAALSEEEQEASVTATATTTKPRHQRSTRVECLLATAIVLPDFERV